MESGEEKNVIEKNYFRSQSGTWVYWKTESKLDFYRILTLPTPIPYHHTDMAVV